MSFSRPRRVLHLGRRWWGSVRARQLNDGDLAWVRGHLLEGEFLLWMTMDWRDQRHALQVARRFVALAQSASLKSPSRDALAAALLHDVGKAESQLSTFERVLAAVFGAKTERFRSYLDHEALGWNLCQEAGSTATTLDLLAGRGEELDQRLLRNADNI